MNKILLVEDDEFLRTLYLDLLTQEKYHVDPAENGQIAYEKIRKGCYDLILLDMILPGINGMEIIEKLKSDNPQALRQHIVFLTNLDSKNEMLQKVTAKGFSYLIKSDLNPDEFIKAIQKFLTV